AGDQQHAQVLADALDDVDRTVVGRGDLAVERVDLELQDIVAAARYREAQRLLRAGGGDLRGDLVAVETDGHPCAAAWSSAVVDHAEGEILRFADDAEAGSVHHLDA